MQCSQSVPERIFAATVASTVIALLLRETFAAPVRVYVPNAWYIADALMLFSLVAFFFCGLPFYPKGAVLMVITIIGLILISFFLLDPKSTIFASRYLLCFCIGALSAHNGFHVFARARFWLAVLVLISSGSIIYDDFVGFEWPETKFATALGTDSAVQRVWWRGDDERRCAGFSQASTDAALFLACSLTMVLYQTSQGKFLQSLLLCITGFFALVLTKQAASVIVTGIVLIIFAVSHGFGFKAIHLNRVSQALALVCLALSPFIPFLLSGFNLVNHFGSFASSLNERTTDIWPRAIDRAFSVPTFIIGDGFGSVGQPGSYTSMKMVEVPDNAFLFLVIQLGILAILLFVIAIYIVARADVSKTESSPCFVIVALLSLNGFTANIGHNVTACLFLGYSLTYLAVQSRPVFKSEFF